MDQLINRRDLLKLAGMGVVVFVSGTTVRAGRSQQKENDSFYFVQLSDTHWGFNGPAINPDSQGTLKKAVAAVNALDEQPDFVIFTGDLTQTTDNRGVRRDRMKSGFPSVRSWINRARSAGNRLPGNLTARYLAIASLLRYSSGSSSHCCFASNSRLIALSGCPLTITSTVR